MLSEIKKFGVRIEKAFAAALTILCISSGARAQCTSPYLVTPPATTQSCSVPTVHFVVSAAGTPSLQHQWRKHSVPLVDEPGHISGSNASTFHILNVTAADIAQYDCVITNDCGSIATNPVSFLFCPADINCDYTTDFFDYLDFVQAFATLDPAADFNRDSTIDLFDYLDFVDAFAQGCLP